MRIKVGFPEKFLWGAGTSAFQYEGGFKRDGKGWTVADERSKATADQQADTSTASDGYNHISEDVALMKELGLTSYRFSISWARLYPDGDGQLNQAGTKYYLELLKELKKNNIEPVATLLHFDIPWALIEKYEGFVHRDCIDAFERYASTCFELFGDYINYWLTINEQNVMTMIPSMCGLKDDDPDIKLKLVQANYNLYLASAKAVIACRKILPHAQIGPCVSYPTFYPETCRTEDVLLAFDLQEKSSFAPMETYVYGTIPAYVLEDWQSKGTVPQMNPEDEETLKKGTVDYLGLNWYCTQTIGSNNASALMNVGSDVVFKKNPYLEYGEWGWSYDPKALRMALRECFARFKLPIMICENGWSSREELENDKVHDSKRVAYIKDHVIEMRNAIRDGVNLIGYQHWSFVDILSSSQGFEKRYGLIYVDRGEFETNECTRYKKDSFYYYKKVIEKNGNMS